LKKKRPVLPKGNRAIIERGKRLAFHLKQRVAVKGGVEEMEKEAYQKESDMTMAGELGTEVTRKG